VELHFNEVLLINALRTFHAFLSSIGYRIASLAFNGRDGDVIVYESLSRNRRVHIGYVVGFDILIIRRRNHWFLTRQETVSLKDVKMRFADFAGLSGELDVANNITLFNGYKRLMSEKLLPILNGEKWFSEL